MTIASVGAARAHPGAWASYASNGRWKRARHLDFIGDRLLEMEQGKAPPRLVVSCPPRCGKSWFISRFFTSWVLGRHPSWSVVLVTFQERFSRKWGRLSRDAFCEHAEEVWGVTTPPRSSTAEWEVYRGHIRTEGVMQAIGAGGAITGKGANVLVIDDLIRDLAEAQSAGHRERQWEWFQSAVETRLEPPGLVVIISTRWHHHDLIGRLMGMQKDGELGDEYRFINLPALAEENDPMGRKPGEPLWPERFNKAWLEKKQKNVGPYVWGSLYQGRPVPASGAVFKKVWFRYYEPGDRMIKVPSHGAIDVNELRRFGTVDLAASKKKKADFTAIGSWGYHPRHHALFLLDVTHARMSPNEIIPAMDLARRVNKLPVLYVERVTGFLEEKFGDLLQDAKRAGLPVVSVPVVGDKLARAISASGPFAAGQVYFRERATWLGTLEEEMLSFTGVDDTHDDLVDMCTIAVAVYQECEASNGSAFNERARGPDIQVEEQTWDPGFQGEWT